VKGSLSAEVTLYCDQELLRTLAQLGDELRFVTITSEARLMTSDQRPKEAIADPDCPGLWVEVVATEAAKCERCWHHRADVGSTLAHPELCGRCVDNVEGAGEERTFA